MKYKKNNYLISKKPFLVNIITINKINILIII